MLPRKLNWVYSNHILHHAGDNSQNIALSPVLSTLIWLPIGIVLFCFSLYGWLIISWLTVVTHAILWTVVHYSIHDLKYERIAQFIPFYKAMRANHLEHHRNPRTCFAVIHLWTDYIFRTKS